MNGTKERLNALLTAVVFLLTLFGAALSYAQSVNAIPITLKTAVNWMIVAIVIINAVLSVFILFYVWGHLGSADAKKAYAIAIGTTASAVWDVVALILAVMIFADQGIYTYLAVVLVADAIIDLAIHFKR